jgi:flagellin-like protein
MALTRKNDEAVSPVIGVILMVAITVILAAVIAAFVFGMSGNISKSKIVAVTAQQPDADHITVTYQGGQDAGSFVTGTVVVTPATACTAGVVYTNDTAAASATKNILGTSVGSYVTATCPLQAGIFTGKDHVVATGKFGDGSQQVLLDTYV